MPVRIVAAAVLALESVGVAVLLVLQFAGLFAGDVASVPSALALIVLTLVGLVAVAGFALATARGLSWGRSGGIVVQVMILAVALGALTGAGASPAIAAAIASPGAVGLIALLLAARAAAPRRDHD